MLDLIGWAGNAFAIGFYWLSGSGHMRLAYWLSIVGCVIWAGVGLALGMSSVVAMELIIAVLCLRGLWKLRICKGE